MACGCGGGSKSSLAYQVTYTTADGVKAVEYVADIGAYRMLRQSITAGGGVVSSAVQVPRKKMDEWAAARAGAA